MPNDNYVEVGTGQTNSTPGSNVDIFLTLDGPSICPNMTDADFRTLVMGHVARAVPLVATRIKELRRWPESEKKRVFEWFGANDEGTHGQLLTGLTAVQRVLSSLKPINFIRSGSERDMHLGCVPSGKNREGEAAHVCGPDTATHTICISERFCTMRHWSSGSDSQVSTIIHECTHFFDTMATVDNKYTITRFLQDWGQQNPALAITNADSVAGYVVYEN